MRGQPDYGAYAAKEVTASISDMGEVAARLGSIVVYDKRGDVVHFDNFEDAILKWHTIVTDALCYTRFDSTHVRSGSQAVKLHTRALNGYLAGLVKAAPILVSKRVGVEISFSNISYNCFFSLELYFYDGALLHYGEVKIYPFTGKVYIWDKTETDREIADLGKHLVYAHFYNTIKLVVDFKEDKFMRLLYNLNEYDLSAYETFTEEAADVETQYLVRVRIQATSNDENDGWVDDFIFTQAEP